MPHIPVRIHHVPHAVLELLGLREPAVALAVPDQRVDHLSLELGARRCGGVQVDGEDAARDGDQRDLAERGAEG